MLPGGGTETRPALDERWSTKDDVERYRAILKIHDRERKLRSREAVESKKRISRRLSTFREDVKRFRRIASDVAKSRHGSLLQDRRDLRLKCHGRRTEEIHTYVHEESHRKRRKLDQLRYEKKSKLKRCFQLQLERAELSGDYEREEQGTSVVTRHGTQQQRLITYYQRSVAKQNAAKAINLTYAWVLAILKKDAVHRETLLNALKEDQKSRCDTMLRTTILGQLAVEEFDDVGERYKRAARKVSSEWKERERALTFVRDQVEDLWSYARSLIRTESETTFSMEITRNANSSNVVLDGRIRSLEEVFDKIQDALLVRSYRELLSRLEEQMKRRTRLLERFDRNVKERESLLNKKNEALSALSEAERTLMAGVEEYNADKNVLLERIAIQQKRKLDNENVKKDHGKLLMDIRATLQNMVAMLVCVRRGGGPTTAAVPIGGSGSAGKLRKRTRDDTADRRRTRDDVTDRRRTRDDVTDRRRTRDDVTDRRRTRDDVTDRRRTRDDTVVRRRTTIKERQDDTVEQDKTSRLNVPQMISVETEGLALLSTVSRRIGALFGMSNFELDGDRDERARDLYRTYVSNYRSKLKFADAEAGSMSSGLLVERELMDSSVPTRLDIKLKSERAVEAYFRLLHQH